VRRALRKCAAGAGLSIFDEHARRPTRAGVQEIPIDAITGTFEPHRAAHFASEFRPAPAPRGRWLRLWQAEARGAVLPPISVAAVGDAYAVRDGHHRVSVARARGGLTITALVA